MPRSKFGLSTLSGLVDSDPEDSQFIERDAMPTPDSATENMAPSKKGRGRPKSVVAAKVTKAKAAPRRCSERTKASTKGGKRKALADKTNHQETEETEETEEVEEFEQDENTVMAGTTSGDELDATTIHVKEKKAIATKKKPPKSRSKPAKDVSTHTDYSIPADNTLEAPRLESRGPKKNIKAQREASAESEKVVLESHVPEIELDDHGTEEIEETISKSARLLNLPRSDSRSRQPSVQRIRAGSASDTERSDPALRRKLGEMTKKYENLDIKYRDLRELGLKEAERNFDRLKKQTDEKTSVSNELIASLKADLAAQSALAKDARNLKKKIESQNTEISSLHAKLSQMAVSLSEAQSENKTLSTKLAANRNVAASVESANAKAPGSAFKVNGGIRMIGSAEAAQVAQAAQLTEDLYSDLTGLIVRSVKREPEEDVFDCIQTGRNGTLHFKLAIANEKAAESYDDAQCVYVPQLDPSRDKTMTDLLPDYLVDEITFPRPQAAKFYARVVKALTEKGN